MSGSPKASVESVRCAHAGRVGCLAPTERDGHREGMTAKCVGYFCFAFVHKATSMEMVMSNKI